MHRRFALFTVFTLLLALLAVPASAKQPADVAALVDAALGAKLHATSQAQEALNAAPGQSSTKIAERQARLLKDKLDRIAEKWGASAVNHPGKAIGLHALLNGCNPGDGHGLKLGHAYGHRWSSCAVATTALAPHSGPPGHDPNKVKGDDDLDD